MLKIRTNYPIPPKRVGKAHIKGWRCERMDEQYLIYMQAIKACDQTGISKIQPTERQLFCTLYIP